MYWGDFDFLTTKECINGNWKVTLQFTLDWQFWSAVVTKVFFQSFIDQRKKQLE